jgi:hypothetical protein
MVYSETSKTLKQRRVARGLTVEGAQIVAMILEVPAFRGPSQLEGNIGLSPVHEAVVEVLVPLSGRASKVTAEAIGRDRLRLKIAACTAIVVAQANLQSLCITFPVSGRTDSRHPAWRWWRRLRFLPLFW